MAHTGFAIFFMLLLMVALAALIRVALQNFQRIKQALDGIQTIEEPACDCRVRVCPTAEVPRIAARLNVRFPEGLAPVRHVQRAWPFEPRQRVHS